MFNLITPRAAEVTAMEADSEDSLTTRSEHAGEAGGGVVPAGNERAHQQPEGANRNDDGNQPGMRPVARDARQAAQGSNASLTPTPSLTRAHTREKP